MPTWLYGIYFGLLFLTQIAEGQPIDDRQVNRCGTADYEQVLQKRDPFRQLDRTELNRQIEQASKGGKSARQSATTETIYRIPVVVHIVHNNASQRIGGPNNANISDEQVYSQIKVLNEDFRRVANTNGFNTSPVGADTGIEFFLAQTDPQGNPTNGITRHYYPQQAAFTVGTGSDGDILLAQIAYWPSNRYLNIWVTDLQNNYLGFTQFPTSADTLKGLGPTDTNELVDGSIISYRVFGRGFSQLHSTYNLGRTLTHEIGHWLGLLHPNGDSTCGDDHVQDTPPTDNLNQSVFCRDLLANCAAVPNRIMIENYMMYSPDACMNLFTQGQKERMRAVLQLSPRRAALIRSLDNLPETDELTVTVFPNPTRANPTVEIQFKGLHPFTITVTNSRGQRLYSMVYPAAPSSRITVPVSRLPAGIYTIQVTTDTATVSQRLLIE
ncbi:hypothetical protein GCM10028825_07350 [Spirosoma agri]